MLRRDMKPGDVFWRPDDAIEEWYRGKCTYSSPWQTVQVLDDRFEVDVDGSVYCYGEVASAWDFELVESAECRCSGVRNNPAHLLCPDNHEVTCDILSTRDGWDADCTCGQGAP